MHTVRFLKWLTVQRYEQYYHRMDVSLFFIFQEMKEQIETRLAQMYEIDLLIMKGIQIPTPSKYKGTQDYNSFKRVTELYFPKTDKLKPTALAVTSDFEYSIYLGHRLPNFVMLSQVKECLVRLILKAAFTDSIEHFKLTKSNC